MPNKEMYNKVFMDTFSIWEDRLKGLEYQAIEEWDSVGHMELISNIENAFDISLETEDIVDLSSYEKGIEILKKYGINI
ncbi:MAG: acyl carrier protein [Fretibacterium sp.]|nr:acyl carrier protein [Fretibacterium sp.]